MSFENFPYSNFHDMNLDWIISQWLETKKAFTTYEDAFKDLRDYIQNFFDNLDLQDEVNIKIDEMLDDGTLATIINSVLLSQKLNVFPYDSKIANVNTNDILYSGGVSSFNDYGGNLYSVSNTAQLPFTKKFGDKYLLQLGDVLNACSMGCDNTGSVDISDTLNNILNNITRDTTIFFPTGTYRITKGVTVPEYNVCVSLVGSPSTIFKIDDGSNGITVGGTTKTVTTIRNNAIHCRLQGFTMYGGASQITVKTNSNIYIIDLFLDDFTTYGINAVSGAELMIDTIKFAVHGANSATALNVTAPDCKIRNISSYNCKFFMYSGSEVFVENTHAVIDLTNYEGSICFKPSYQQFSSFTNCYCDNYQTGWKVSNTVTLTNCCSYFYMSKEHYTNAPVIFDCSSGYPVIYSNIYSAIFGNEIDFTVLKTSDTTFSYLADSVLTVRSNLTIPTTDNIRYISSTRNRRFTSYKLNANNKYLLCKIWINQAYYKKGHINIKVADVSSVWNLYYLLGIDISIANADSLTTTLDVTNKGTVTGYFSSTFERNGQNTFVYVWYNPDATSNLDNILGVELLDYLIKDSLVSVDFPQVTSK